MAHLSFGEPSPLTVAGELRERDESFFGVGRFRIGNPTHCLKAVPVADFTSHLTVGTAIH